MTKRGENLEITPRWVRAADLLALALLAIAAWSALTGGNRSVVFGIVLSTRSALLFLYTAASLLIVRHVLVPQPTALAALRGGVQALGDHQALAAAVGPFLFTRVAVFLVAVFSVVTFGVVAKPGFVLSSDPVANLPARYDAGWYGGIALDGYHWDHQVQRQRNIAFFPALPLLMRPVGAVFGMYDRTAPRERRMLRALWGGVVLSLAAFLWALWYFVRVSEELIGLERAASAALLLAAYPFACFYGAPYTESIFLLGAVGAWYHFRRGQWVAASAFGFLAGLSRPNGCLLSVPLGILALQHGWTLARDRADALDRGAIRATTVRLVVAAMPGFGMLAFTGYLYTLSGVWFVWVRNQQAWGREFGGSIFASLGTLGDRPLLETVAQHPFNTLNTLGLLFALALIVPVFRRLGLAWGAFVMVNIGLPLMSGVLSMGRLTSTMFPLFLTTAAVLPARAVPWCAAAFALLQGLCAALFYTWRELF